jgi:cytochrome c oxidase cbb3-type subunit 3
MCKLPRIIPTLVLFLSVPAMCVAQVSRDPKQIELGRAIFRVWCAPCHGIRAQGGRGPDLTRGSYNNGNRDSDLFRVISRGVRGTEMPSFGSDLDSASIWLLVSFLRSTEPEASPVVGDRSAGERLFWGRAGCGQCHLVRNRGGRLGPDLTKVGRQRSVSYLRESILSPGADLSPGYETITVVTHDGRNIVGVHRRLDNFSMELMDVAGKLYSFRRSQLASVIRENRSLMPDSYSRLFSKSELDDIVAYLTSLRGSVAPAAGRIDAQTVDDSRLLKAQDDPAAADVWAELRRMALQPAPADRHPKCIRAPPAMDLPDAGYGQDGDNAVGLQWHDGSYWTLKPRLRAGSLERPEALGISRKCLRSDD